MKQVPNLMKMGVAVCILFFLHDSSFAQSNSNTLLTKSYDTTLTSVGFGGYTLSFPQWNPDSGTLAAVKISATTTSKYQYTLKNNDVATSTYLLSIGQEDRFVSSALPSTYTNLTSQDLGSFTLDPGQSITQAPFYFLNGYVATDSVTAVGPFFGTGKINISYTSYTYTNLGSYNNSSYAYSTTIADNMKVSLQYLYYKAGVVLATGLSYWNALPEWPSSALLSWAMPSEKSNRTYIIQRSDDGKNFTAIASVPASPNGATAQYTYTDELHITTPQAFYYRLEVRDSDYVSWSSVKQVLLGWNPSGFKVFPNPATDYVNISTGTAGDWQTDIITAAGAVVQHDVWSQASDFQVRFRNRLAPGAYFLRAVNTKTQNIHTVPFVIVHL